MLNVSAQLCSEVPLAGDSFLLKDADRILWDVHSSAQLLLPLFVVEDYSQPCIFTGVSNIVYTAEPTLCVVCCTQVQKHSLWLEAVKQFTGLWIIGCFFTASFTSEIMHCTSGIHYLLCLDQNVEFIVANFIRYSDQLFGHTPCVHESYTVLLVYIY